MRLAYLFIVLIAPLGARQESVDYIKKKVLNRLEPYEKSLFQEFFTRYDTMVCSFLDTRNNQSLSEHIDVMQSELKILQSVCQDARFSTVHEYIQPYHQQISNMVQILAEYIHSDNSWGLALRMRAFKFLLPDSVTSQGDLHLLGALRHRLSCKK